MDGDAEKKSEAAAWDRPPANGSEPQDPRPDTNITSAEAGMGEPKPKPKPDADTQTGETTAPESLGDELDLSSPPLPKLRYSLLMTGLGCGLFLAMLDTSIVATSLHTIAAEFQDLERINWVPLAYTLTFLSCAVLFARISDVVGRRAAFLSAYIIFIVFSLACGWAKSLDQLVAFRALQGIGGSGLYSITMIVMPELTPDEKKKIIAGIVGIVLATAGVLGPVLGGVLTHGPIGGVSAILFYLSWPEKKYLPPLERRLWREVDFLGSFLLVASAVLIVFSFQNSGSEGGTWGEAVFIGPLVTGVASLVALFAWQFYLERRWGDKMAAAIPLALLRNKAFTAGMLTTMAAGFPYMLSLYVFPIRFQIVNGKSALDAGLMLLPMLAATAVGSALGGVFNDKKNRLAETMVAACIMMIIGCALETTASSDPGLEPKVLGFLVFIGLGFGLSATGSTMLAATESTIQEHASAQGLVAQVRILGGSIGIAASSAILGVKSKAAVEAGAVSASQLSHVSSEAASVSPEQWAVIRGVYTDTLKEGMTVGCIVLAAGVVASLFVYSRSRVPIEEKFRQRYREEAERRQRTAAKPESPHVPAKAVV
ncbi:major facilitator superfamily transporter [Lasiosphaeria ovina]|uniref:Major facilitator superfamily transporter n=1 Tax=Lasiosphaeria ovina TaxID=92902 RepID=A0AAE0TTA3_9PEZI|nr:major facilitator superfamily transporter [Lasiosphaeria ovina]